MLKPVYINVVTFVVVLILYFVKYKGTFQGKTGKRQLEEVRGSGDR